ncbi:MAG: radical SAM protein [Proteobacteria bacterium]|nr:radical SAM protein [Pseudomonadota bacterium]
MARYVDIRLSRSLRRPPKSLPILLLWITDRCNLRCAMCGDQWRAEQNADRQLLSFEDLENLVAAAKRLHTLVISITGGEPLLRPDIFRILKLIKEAGIAANICTNGTLLNEECVRKLTATSLKSISVSLDSGDALIHDTLRGKTGAFHSTVAGIKLLRKALPELSININCTISRKNFREMPEMVLLAADLGCNKISFAPIHTNLQHQHRPEEQFDDLIFSEEDLKELKGEIAGSKKLAAEKGIRTSSDIFLGSITDFYHEPLRWHDCYAGYASCAVSPWGEVSPCVDLPSTLDLHEKSLDTIWRSAEFQQLRNKVDSCAGRCWDTTNAEIAIRFTTAGLLGELWTILHDLKTYSGYK